MKSSFILFVLFAVSACATNPTRKSYTPYEAPAKPAPKVNLIKRAQEAYSRGEYGNAIEALNSIQEKKLKDSERAEYWNLKGLVRLAEKNPVSAEIDFRRAIDSNQSPEYTGYYQYNLASSLQEQGKREAALKELNSVDLATMDQSDQKKVAALRERIVGGDTSPTTSLFPSVPSRVAGVVGSSGATSPSPTPSASVIPPPPAQVYSGPVNSTRVGLLLPLSGKYESFGKKVQKSIELAFQNSTDPKVKSYELIPVDSGDTPASNLEALKKLVEEHQVIAIIGPLLSKGLEALSEKSNFYQVPLISIAQVQGPVSSSLFSCAISIKDQASRMAEYAIKSRGFKRFAILAPSNKAGEEMAHAFWDEVQARGAEVKGFELYDPDLTDFREPVDKTLGLFYTETRAKELKDLADKRKELNITKKTMKTIQYFSLPPIIDFDAVFIADEAKTVGQIIPTFTYRDAKSLNFLGITTWNSNQLLTRAGEQAEGAIFPVSFNTLKPPVETKRFYDLYSATYSTYPGELDAIAFDAASMVIKTLNENPSTREEFKFKLETAGNIEGATGTLTMDAHRCSRNLALYTIKKSKFEMLNETASSEPPSSEGAEEKSE